MLFVLFRGNCLMDFFVVVVLVCLFQFCGFFCLFWFFLRKRKNMELGTELGEDLGGEART